MAKLTLDPVTNLEAQTSALTTINANSQLISDAFDNTLSRDGSGPNAMASALDMNSNRIINLPKAINPTDPVRLMDLPALGSGGGGGDGDGGIGNGVIGRLFWDLNAVSEPRLRIIPSLSLADPQLGDTTNPGGYKTTNLMFWQHIKATGQDSKQVSWFNLSVDNVDDLTTVSKKNSIYAVSIRAYNKVQQGTGIDPTGVPLSKCIIDAGGTGFTSAPLISFVGGGGSGATALATVVAGVLTHIKIVDGGDGFTTVPAVAITGGGGTGAAAHATLLTNAAHPQEVGPLNIQGVTAAGNTTSKTEGIVCFVAHEDNTSDGKLVSGQFGCQPKGADPGRGQGVEDSDGDQTNGPYQCHILRLNFAGDTRGHSAINIKSGKKLGSNLPMYVGVGIDGESIYLGARDQSYVAGVDDPLSGRAFVHWGVSALNGWGWLGLGTDDPSYHIDLQTQQLNEIVDIVASNFDDNAASIATANREVGRYRVFSYNDHTDPIEMVRMSATVVDPTKGSEDATFVFSTMTAGSLTPTIKMSAGTWVGGGVDPGIGALGADQLKITTVGGIASNGRLQGTAMAAAKAAFAAATDVASLKAAAALVFA